MEGTGSENLSPETRPSSSSMLSVHRDNIKFTVYWQIGAAADANNTITPSPMASEALATWIQSLSPMRPLALASLDMVVPLPSFALSGEASGPGAPLVGAASGLGLSSAVVSLLLGSGAASAASAAGAATAAGSAAGLCSSSSPVAALPTTDWRKVPKGPAGVLADKSAYVPASTTSPSSSMYTQSQSTQNCNWLVKKIRVTPCSRPLKQWSNTRFPTWASMAESGSSKITMSARA
mmetsp:Transcript_35248/g.92346  ORF Transcript_35248/g.92346 Transcript_35248/m.92346 type:complete len:236 (-) Transcript_35248:1715-2422(-)